MFDVETLDKIRTVEIDRDPDLEAHPDDQPRPQQTYGHVSQFAFSADGKKMAFGLRDRAYVL